MCSLRNHSTLWSSLNLLPFHSGYCKLGIILLSATSLNKYIHRVISQGSSGTYMLGYWYID